MQSHDLCEFLDWDSDFFGRRIARVMPGRLTSDMADQVMAWCSTRAVECLYFLADADDMETVRLAEDRGFRLVDVRLLMERPISETADFPVADSIRPGMLTDVSTLRAIARSGYRDTRFYYDAQFSSAMADAFYETWTENSCLGYADVVLVAEGQGQAAGYITGQLEDTVGKIGLMGVSEAAQGQAIERALVLAALNWFSVRGVQRVTTATQARNVHMQRVLQRCGFVTRSAGLWYHRWFLSDPAS